MAKTARGKSTPGQTTHAADEATESQRAGPTDEEIAVRAYHIYLERGEEGDQVDDWLQAERELTEGQ